MLGSAVFRSTLSLSVFVVLVLRCSSPLQAKNLQPKENDRCYTEPYRPPVVRDSILSKHEDSQYMMYVLALEGKLSDGLGNARQEKQVFPQSKTLSSHSKSHVTNIPSQRITSASPRVDSAHTSTSKSDTSEFIPWSEFRWADKQLYTVTGDPPRRYTEIQPAPALTFFGTYMAVLIALHYYQEVTFWSATQSFRIRDNWDESLGANYFGHAIAGYFISYVSEHAMIASGISAKLAPLYGGLMGLGYQIYVEVLDGFGSDFSLSPYEMYANVLGITYWVLSNYVPSLQNWSPKYSYYPSKWFGGLPKAASQTPIDDYSAWNFWVSANIPNLTDHKWAAFWPDWLALSVGYGARNLGDIGESRIVTLGFDYDLQKLLPEGGAGWNFFRQTLNFFKFPSPTIEWRFSRQWKSIRPARFYLLYPFPINIGKLHF